MNNEDMLKRLYIISAMKPQDAVIEYPHKIPYYPITEEDKEAIEQVLKEYTIQTNRINETIHRMEEHIKHCELEAAGSLHNEKCHIALKFDKHILSILRGNE